jgi:hypothetical protein
MKKKSHITGIIIPRMPGASKERTRKTVSSHPATCKCSPYKDKHRQPMNEAEMFVSNLLKVWG